MQLSTTDVQEILTRTGGYLEGIASHSLQPYRGCALGNSLCGVGCYVRHNIYVTRGAEWGSFVEVRQRAAEAYLTTCRREGEWARRRYGRFGIFMSSSTEPFQPVERRARVTRQLLEAMLAGREGDPAGTAPDELIIQTHSHHVADYLELYRALAGRCKTRAAAACGFEPGPSALLRAGSSLAGLARITANTAASGRLDPGSNPRRIVAREFCSGLLDRVTSLRVHISIETDRDRLPGLPPSASSVRRRLEAAAALREAGIAVVITVAPLLPIERPAEFFEEIARCADSVVIDHFIGGDGSPKEDGGRTRRTGLPQAMAACDPASVTLEYRERMIELACAIMPGRVGVGRAGFAGVRIAESSAPAV